MDCSDSCEKFSDQHAGATKSKQLSNVLGVNSAKCKIASIVLIKLVEASDTTSKIGAQLLDASGAGEDSGYC